MTRRQKWITAGSILGLGAIFYVWWRNTRNGTEKTAGSTKKEYDFYDGKNYYKKDATGYYKAPVWMTFAKSESKGDQHGAWTKITKSEYERAHDTYKKAAAARKQEVETLNPTDLKPMPNSFSVSAGKDVIWDFRAEGNKFYKKMRGAKTSFWLPTTHSDMANSWMKKLVQIKTGK